MAHGCPEGRVQPQSRAQLGPRKDRVVHASIRQYNNVALSTGEILAAARHVTSDLGRAPGFVSWAVIDVGDGVLISITVFQTEADLQHGDHLLAIWLTDYVAGLPQRDVAGTTGEVIIQKGL
jgi:hypothetical protein